MFGFLAMLSGYPASREGQVDDGHEMMPAVFRRMIVISSGLGRERRLQASAQGACSTHCRDGLSAASHVVENTLHSERGMRSVVPCGGSSGSSVEEASVWPTKAPHLKQPGYPKR